MKQSFKKKNYIYGWMYRGGRQCASGGEVSLIAYSMFLGPANVPAVDRQPGHHYGIFKSHKVKKLIFTSWVENGTICVEPLCLISASHSLRSPVGESSMSWISSLKCDSMVI